MQWTPYSRPIGKTCAHLARSGSVSDRVAYMKTLSTVRVNTQKTVKYDEIQHKLTKTRKCITSPRSCGVKTLWTRDTSDPRHFGTSAEVFERHFGTKEDTSAPCYTGWQGGQLCLRNSVNYAYAAAVITARNCE